MPVPVTRAIQDSISNLYISILGRNPDPAGFSYWVDQLANQNNTPQALTSITLNFSNAPEFKATYGSLTTDAAVALMYRNVLNRDADAPGLAYWAQQATNYINAGYTVSQAYALTGNALIVGAANNAGTADATLILGKQTAAVAAGNATPVTTYTLSTSSPETITATGLNNVINGTQATFQAGDVITGNSSSISNTLKLVDNGTAAWTLPAATVSGVQTISLQNINGVAAVTGVNEVATMQFRDLGAGQAVSIAGITFTAGNAGATAAQVAAAYTTATITATTAAVAGGILTPTGGAAGDADTRAKVNAILSTNGYTAAAGTTLVNSVAFTATTNANVVDLVATGTAVTGKPQVTVLTIGTSTGTGPVTFTANGVTVTSASPTAGNADAYGVAVAAAINAYYGSTIAVAGGTAPATNVVTITSPTALNLAGFSGTNFVVTSYALATGGNYAAPAAPTVTITPAVIAVTAGSLTDIVNASNFTGATSFVSERSVGQINFTNLTSAQSVTKDSGSGAVDATWGTTGVAPVINIANGSTGGAVSVTAPNATSLTINSTGAANTIGALGAPASATALNINATTNLTTGAITATAVTGINVSGAATLVTLGTLPAAVTTINGSGLTAGGIAVTLTNTVTSFTGGAGVDTVTTVSTTTAASTINGGGGAGDILNVNDTTSISTAALGARFTNFEVLRNTAGGATANVSTVAGITAIQLGGNGQGATGMTAAQALAVSNRVDNATQTLALTTATGTSDVLTVTLQNSTATASADLTSTTVTGFETMNVISSSGGAADINSLTFANAGQLRAVNVSGAFPLTMTTANLTAVGGTAINASAVTFAGTSTTAAFTISGNLLKGSEVIGSNTVDAITTSALVAGAAGEFVTYNAGGGNDAIISTVGAINNTSAASASLKIEGGTGTDTLTVSEAAIITITDATFQYLTGIETVVLATGDNAITVTTGGFFNTNFGGNTTTTLTLGGADNLAINTLNAATATGNLTVGLTAGATTAAQTVTTGSGADIITVTAALYTGANNGILVNAGAGNDRITIANTVATGVANAINITGGLGADTITVGTAGAASAHSFVTYVTAVNESTLTAFDNITGYFNGATRRSDTIDFTGNAVVQADASGVAIAGFTSGELTYSITTGVMSFAGTAAAALTVAQKAAIAQAAITTDLRSVVFTQAAANATTDSYVFNNNTLGDSLVQLIGVTATSLVSTGTAGAGVVAIA